MAKKLSIIIDVDAKTGDLKILNSELDNLGKSTTKADKSVKNIEKSLVSFGASVLSIYGISEAVGGAVSAFRELETATAGIAKTTGMSADEISQLRDEFRDMTSEMKGFKTTDLLAIAEAAGQLGITGVDNIAQFTESIQMVAMTTELTADQAATQFARLSNSLKLPLDDIENITSAFNELSNTTTATVGDILLFSQRMSASATSFGLTASELAGLSATMKDVGLNFELGGTAMNKVMMQMQKEVADFAKVSGKSFKDFSKTLKDEPIKALEQFLKALSTKEPKEFYNTLEDLKLTSDGVTQTLGKLSDNVELLQKNISTSNEAFREAISIRKEYAVVSETMDKKIDSMVDSLELFGESMVNEFNEPIKDGIDEIEELFRYLATGKGEIDGLAKSLLVFGQIAAVIATATIAMKTFNAVTKANPWILGATALIAGISYLKGEIAEWNTELQNNSKVTKENIRTQVDLDGQLFALGTAYQQMYDRFAANGSISSAEANALLNLQEKMISISKEEVKAVKEVKKVRDEAIKDGIKGVKEFVKTGEKGVNELTKAEKKAADERKKIHKKFLEDKKKVTEQFNNDYNKAFLETYELEELALQKQIAEYRKYVDDKLKIDELYQKKHFEIIYKDQDKNLKLALEAYKAAGEEEIASEIEKVIKKNEITEKYGDILTADQLTQAKELSDKKIDIAITGEKKVVDEIKTLWDDLGDSLGTSFTNAFDQILFRGASFSKTMKDMFTGIAQESSQGFMQLLSQGSSGGDILSQGSDLISGGYGSLTGSIDAQVGNALGVNNWLGSNLGTSVGQIAGAGMIGYGVGSIGDMIGGTNTEAANYGAIGAAIGSVVPVIGTAIGAAVGSVVGGMMADWESKYAGVSLDGSGGVQSFEVQEKNRWFGKWDKKRTVYDEASVEIIAYFDGVYNSIDQINNIFDTRSKLDLTGNIKTKNISEEVSKALLKALNPTELNLVSVRDGISGMFDIIQNAVVEASAQASQDLKVEKLYSVWEDYAERIGTTTEQALMAAVNQLEVDQSQFSGFLEGWQGAGSPLYQLQQNMKTSMDSFRDAIKETDGAAGVSLANFEQLRTQMVEGIGFDPENIANWRELQATLEASAVNTRNFADALGGMIENYDVAIQSFDQVIAEFQGITLEAERQESMTVAAIENLANAVLAEDDQGKQLQLSEQFLSGIQQLNQEQDARFQQIVDGSATDTTALALEFSQMLSVGLTGLSEDITRINAEIITAQNEGDNEALLRLNEQLALLTTQQAKLEDIAVRADNEGLSAEIAQEFQSVNDIALAQMAESVREGLISAQATMEQLQAEANAYLANIEGALAEPDQGLTDLNANLVSWNTDQATANAGILAGLETLPTEITAGLTTAVEPMTATLTNVEAGFLNLPTEINAGMVTAMEPIATGMQESREAMTALPEQIGTGLTTAIEPMTAVMTELPTQIDTSLTTAMAPIGESLTALPVMIDTSLQTMSTSMTTSITEMSGTLTTTLTSSFDVMSSDLQTVSTNLQTMSSDMASSMDSMASNIESSLSDNFSTMSNDLRDLNSDMSSTMQTMASDIDGALRDSFSTMSSDLQSVSTNLNNMANDMSSSMQTMSNDINSTLQSSFSTMSSDFQSLSSDFSSNLTNLTSSMDASLSGLSGVFEASFQASNNVMQEMSNVIGTLPSEIGNSLDNSMSAVVTELGSVSAGIDRIPESLGRSVSDSLSPITSSISGLNSSISDLVSAENRTTEAVNNSASLIGNAIGNQLSGLMTKIDRSISASESAASEAAKATKAANASATANANLQTSMSKLSTAVSQNTQATKVA